MNKLKYDVSTKSPKVGEHLKLIVQIPEGLNFNDPSIKITSSLVEGQVSDFGLMLITKPDVTANKIILDIVAYRNGPVSVPAVKIEQNGSVLFETDEFFISVVGKTIDKTTSLVEIRDPHKIPLPFYYYVGIAVAAATLFFAGRYFYKKIKSLKKIPPQMNLSPYLKAIKNLQELEVSYTSNLINYNLYVTKTSLVVKRFINDEYKLNVMDLTTKEVAVYFKERNIFQIELINHLKYFFNSADNIKFSGINDLAKYDFLKEARAFVEMLKKPEVIEAPKMSGVKK